MHRKMKSKTLIALYTMDDILYGVYDSPKDMALELGLDRKNVNCILTEIKNGKRKTMIYKGQHLKVYRIELEENNNV